MTRTGLGLSTSATGLVTTILDVAGVAVHLRTKVSRYPLLRVFRSRRLLLQGAESDVGQSLRGSETGTTRDRATVTITVRMTELLLAELY